MSSTSSVPKCSTCSATFSKKEDLTKHLRDSPSCKTVRKAPGARIAAVFPATTPDTAASNRPAFEDASLLRAMESGMKKEPSSSKSGLEMSVLSSIAEDAELATAYKKLSVSSSGSRTLTAEIVSKAAVKSKIDVNRVVALIKRAQNVSICFVLDTTGSMLPYISGVKDQIFQIVDQVQASRCGVAGLAFVGYKDWCDGRFEIFILFKIKTSQFVCCTGENHFEILPFTKDPAAFKNFVATVRAGHHIACRLGRDIPEDVIGGLNQAIKLTWPESSGTRVLFHMGDAPPHGKGLYHNDGDNYPKGHPKDRPLGDIFQDLESKDIAYYFGRINNQCDRMIDVFQSFYGEKIDRLESANVETITSHVTTSVMKSVTATCSATLSSIHLTGANLRKFELDSREPDWSTIPEVSTATSMTFKLPESIDAITSFAKMEEVVKKCGIQIARNPFAKGSVRLAYYGGKKLQQIIIDD